jgi:hypothetical protein
MLLVRAGVCFAESVAASLIAAISISVFSPLVGQRYPVAQSLEFTLLLTTVGAAVFAFGILLSTLLGGGWTPLAVGIPVVAGIYTTTKSFDALRPFNPQDLFSAARTVHPPVWSPGPPPWAAISVVLAISLVLLFLSVFITEELEF